MSMIKRVARAICKSKTCEGFTCCQHPANLGRIECPVKAGGYNDAASAAIEAMLEPDEEMKKAAYMLVTFKAQWNAAIHAALNPKTGEQG